MTELIVAELLGHVDEPASLGTRVYFAFELSLIFGEVRGENVSDVQVLRVHLELACPGRDVMDVDVTAIPAPIGQRRPAGKRDMEHSIANVRRRNGALGNA